MAPFNRSYTTYYWSAIVNIALSCTVFSYLTLNNIVTLKSGLEITQDHSNCSAIRKLRSGVLLAFHSNYGSILHHFRDKVRYWSKIVIFFIPTLHSTTPLGGSRRNVAIPFGLEKLESWGWHDSKTFLRYVQRCWQNTGVWQTDRQTDGQADILQRHSARYAYASRGKNHTGPYSVGQIKRLQRDFAARR